MKGPAAYRAELTELLSRTPLTAVLLRLVVVGSALVAMLSVSWSGAEQGVLPGFLVVALAAFATTRPDSYFGALVVAAVMLHWLLTVDEAALVWSLVPALCLLGVHTGLAALCVTSPQSSLPIRSLLRWGGHAGTVAVATVVVWAMSRALESLSRNGAVVLTALGFVLVVATAVTLGQRALVKEL